MPIFSSMEERNKLLRIYGPDLCAQEAMAVVNMMRMFSLTPLNDADEEEEEVFFNIVVVSHNKIIVNFNIIGRSSRRFTPSTICSSTIRFN